jgi:hypothetical protein
MRKSKPLIFLTSLLALVLFLGGFRLGKQVERLDKNYVPPTIITPLPSISPNPTSPIIKDFSHKGCGISFLNATNLSTIKNSSNEALLMQDRERIYATCANGSQKLAGIKDREATESVLIQGQTVRLIKHKGNYYFTILNMKNAKTVYFEVTEALKDLLIKTLSFIK